MGIIVGIRYRGVAVPEAYMRPGNIQGNKNNGWSCNINTYSNKEAADAGQQQLMEFSISAGGSGGMGGPMGANGGAPAPVDATETPSTFNPKPYDALYAKLKESYPKAVDA